MKISFEGKTKVQTLDFTGTVTELVEKLNLQPNATLVARNGSLATDEEILQNSDTILIMSVISGG